MQQCQAPKLQQHNQLCEQFQLFLHVNTLRFDLEFGHSARVNSSKENSLSCFPFPMVLFIEKSTTYH